GELDKALTTFAQPKTDAERFSLAAAQVLASIRDFSTGFNKLSIHPNLRMSGLPFLRAVIQDESAGLGNVATPQAVASLFRELKAGLQRANTTLSQVTGKEEFGVQINFAEACADFSGDGKINPETETLQAAFGRILGVEAIRADPVIVRFDRADAAWLKGYTHFLTGMLDLLTSYDWMPVWNQCAHIIFLNPDPVPGIAKVEDPLASWDKWPDLIAAIHDMRLEPVDVEGPRRFRDSFLMMIAESRICWQRVLEEKDDVHEWLPNPNQKGPRGLTVTRAEIDGWFKVLDELEAIARGKKLLPHWRIRGNRGINVDKFVAAPPKLDLILWIQGSAFLPFVEEGPMSDAETWRTLTGPFGPGFFQFAIWSN
ncbi:MAG: hypothetical protein M3N12_03675, partial [Verrucomicrobiota bacterium]|nr:hypothetical protein [Verrucomicrobiota bacterium]